MRVLNRPMFRKGGSTAQGSGITSLQPRKMYSNGTIDEIIEDIKTRQATQVQKTRELAELTPSEKAILIGQFASTPGNMFEKTKNILPTLAKIAAQKKQAEQTAAGQETQGAVDIAKLKIASLSKAGMEPSKVKEVASLYNKNLAIEQNKLGRELSQTEKDAIYQKAQDTVYPPERKARSAEDLYQAYMLEDRENIKSYMRKIAEAINSNNMGAYNKNRRVLESTFKFIKSNTGIDPQERGLEIPKFDKKMSKAEGGRIGYAEAGPVRSNISPVIPVEEQALSMAQTESPETQTQELKSFSFDELRTKLPPEVTDDIVRLLSNSQDALRDFAYITTQRDINAFNQKYGVNLVLPAEA